MNRWRESKMGVKMGFSSEVPLKTRAAAFWAKTEDLLQSTEKILVSCYNVMDGRFYNRLHLGQCSNIQNNTFLFIDLLFGCSNLVTVLWFQGIAGSTNAQKRVRTGVSTNSFIFSLVIFLVDVNSWKRIGKLSWSKMTRGSIFRFFFLWYDVLFQHPCWRVIGIYHQGEMGHDVLFSCWIIGL